MIEIIGKKCLVGCFNSIDNTGHVHANVPRTPMANGQINIAALSEKTFRKIEIQITGTFSYSVKLHFIRWTSDESVILPSNCKFSSNEF